jgi:predicted enzyme related to lactoylglutathione lyase
MPDSFVTGVDFVALQTRDHEAAAEFYGENARPAVRQELGQDARVEFQAGNLTLAVMQSDAFGLEFAPSSTMVALAVDDVETVRQQLEAKGVEFRGDILDSGVCHQAFFADPDGNPLALHHRYAPRTLSERRQSLRRTVADGQDDDDDSRPAPGA